MQREGYPVLVGMDEVGRGALAGPVSVGVVAIDSTSRSAPSGVKDSKLLSRAAREALVPRIQRWALSWGVGHCGPDEIDRYGIMTGLRMAGQRALASCAVNADLVLLDGNHDWLTDPTRVGLFEGADAGDLSWAPGQDASVGSTPPPPVRTMIKADLSCSSVAAASVLAKVTRDSLMVAWHDTHPVYRWNVNKGYAAPQHLDALREHGACLQHRRSWNLTVTTQEVEPGEC